MLGKSEGGHLLLLLAQRLVFSRSLSFTIMLMIVGYCLYDFIPILGEEIVRPVAQGAGSALRILLFGEG